MDAMVLVCLIFTFVLLRSSNGNTNQTHAVVERTKYSLNGGHCLPSKRILGGGSCSRNEMPSIVQILEKDGTTLFTVCGGTLIKPNLVLTAAHCLSTEKKIWVRQATRNDPEMETEDENQRTEVIAQWKHPQYTNKYVPFIFPNGSNVMILHMRHDIGIMQIEIKPHVVHWRHALAPLPKGRFQADMCSMCTIVEVYGWGRIDLEYRADTLQCVVVPVTPMVNCRKNHALDYTDQELDEYLCTTTKGKMALNGDSGGPVVCENQDVQVAVISWGRFKKNLAIYTRIDQHLDFIDSVMNTTEAQRRRLTPKWNVWEFQEKKTFFNDVSCFVDMIVYHFHKYLHNFHWSNLG